MRYLAAIVVLFLSPVVSFAGEGGKTHLFILSGQSNMAGLKPDVSFTPTVTKALAPDEVIVVHSAQSGQPIRRWYKQWKPAEGDAPKADGALYDKLISAVRAKIGDRKPDTVTFVWMQGERDAKEGHAAVYAASLQGLIGQLQHDLGRNDVHFVIGRLSDHLKTPEWEALRKAQVEVAESSPHGAWVDTDDLNGPSDGLHYNKDGYAELGRRFAEKAIELVGK